MTLSEYSTTLLFGEALSIDDFIEDYVFDNDNLPFDADLQFALHFTKEIETFSVTEYSAQKLFIEKWNETFSDKIESLYQLPDEADFIHDLYSTGHKIGGYPYFTQDDLARIMILIPYSFFN